MWQDVCFGCLFFAPRYDMKSFALSPGCSSKEPKSTVCLSSLGGVPVLSLPVFKFKLLKKSSSPDDLFSLMRPPSFFS